MPGTNYFLKTIEHLRNYEEIILYGNILEITNEQEDETLKYLEKEYQYELADYPKIKIQNFNPKLLYGRPKLYMFLLN